MTRRQSPAWATKAQIFLVAGGGSAAFTSGTAGAGGAGGTGSVVIVWQAS